MQIVSAPEAQKYLENAGLPPAESKAIAALYSEAQLRALKQALLGVVVLALVSFAFTRHLPHGKPVADEASSDAARAGPEVDAA